MRTPLNDKELAWQAWEEMQRTPCWGISPLVRIAIHEAQNWRCCYCGVVMWAGEPFECLGAYMKAHGLRDTEAAKRRRATAEHIRRRIDGGSDLPENLAGACLWCNTTRHDMPAEDWFWKVRGLIEAGFHPHGVRLIGRL